MKAISSPKMALRCYPLMPIWNTNLSLGLYVFGKCSAPASLSHCHCLKDLQDIDFLEHSWAALLFVPLHMPCQHWSLGDCPWFRDQHIARIAIVVMLVVWEWWHSIYLCAHRMDMHFDPHERKHGREFECFCSWQICLQFHLVKSRIS